MYDGTIARDYRLSEPTSRLRLASNYLEAIGTHIAHRLPGYDSSEQCPECWISKSYDYDFRGNNGDKEENVAVQLLDIGRSLDGT